MQVRSIHSQNSLTRQERNDSNRLPHKLLREFSANLVSLYTISVHRSDEQTINNRRIYRDTSPFALQYSLLLVSNLNL